MSDEDQSRRGSGDDPVHHGRYAPGGVEEVNPGPADPFHTEQERDPYDPADARVDPAVLRDGGPTRSGGALTTTGGSAGPASVRRVARRGRVAPTTTGSAETGGMSTPAAGTTSDANGPATTTGRFTDE